MAKHLLLLFLLGSLAACSSLNTTRETPAPVESIGGSGSSQPASTNSNRVLQPPPETGAVPLPGARPLPPETRPSGTWSNTALGNGVQAAIQEGNLPKAAALIERELGITPRDAFLWLQLSYIRAMENRLGEAEGMAQRALSLSRTPAMQDEANMQLQRIRAARS